MYQSLNRDSDSNPRSGSPPAGLPQRQGRHGLSDGTHGLDAARAEPGNSRGAALSPIMIDFALGHGAGAILRELEAIHALLRDAEQPVPAGHLLAAVDRMDNELSYIRQRVRELSKGPAPANPGGSLDVTG